MATRLSRQEADQLAAMPKLISEQIRWTRTGARVETYRFLAAVACGETETSLVLHGVVGKTNWSFVLMVEPDTPIRKLTVHGRGHANPDGSDAGAHHKHVWDEDSKDRETYYPTDIDFTDINAALLGFLAECTITVPISPETLIVERRLK